jgi:hypothetical protein
MHKRTLLAAAALVAVVATAAYAEVIFNAETGTGFVGKGDVQLAMGWNNNQLQANADGLIFSVQSVSVTTWLCYHTDNENAADQERSVSVTTQGLLSHTERTRNQITGFGLDGYDGTPTVVTDGGPVGSCPNPNRELVEGSIEEGEASGFTVYVNGVALN